jgi:Flp pilus assembly protein TadG
MKPTLRVVNPSRQAGAVAVEAALVISFLLIFVSAPSIYFAFYFYQYSAAQKAAHDAALYLSTAPRAEMTTAGPSGGPAAMTLAQAIIIKELAGSTNEAPPDPSIVCGYQQGPTSIGWKSCTTTNNQPLVFVAVSIDMPFMDPLTGYDSGLMISAYNPMRYVGN